MNVLYELFVQMNNILFSRMNKLDNIILILLHYAMIELRRLIPFVVILLGIVPFLAIADPLMG